MFPVSGGDGRPGVEDSENDCDLDEFGVTGGTKRKSHSSFVTGVRETHP